MADPLAALRPHGTPAPATAPDDPRLGRWLADTNRLAPGTRVALVGFPVDTGVARNGGRPGAAEAPAAIRAALYRMTPDARLGGAMERLLDATADLGDVVPTGDLARDQAALGAVVDVLLTAGAIPVVLGGGHETAYGHALGYLDNWRSVEILNWDAHADVRDLVAGPAGEALGHSGSPFRQAATHPSDGLRRYTVAGLHPWRVATDHAAFVEAHGRIVWQGDLDDEAVDALADDLTAPALVTFDLDAVDTAGGVSAPGVGGMPVARWLRAAEACGCSAATSFDVVELNPRHDAEGRSATLAALTVWHVLRGIARR